MRTVSLGSSRGGTGKSFVAARLGRTLAARGLEVALVDLNLEAGDLHLAFGALAHTHGISDFLRGSASNLESMLIPAPDCPGLSIVPGCHETVRSSSLSALEIERLIDAVRALPADVAILDLGAGHGQQQLDLFLAGDVPLVVSTGQLESLRDATNFVRLARLRRGARNPAQSRGHRAKVYTSLDDLVKDMNALREEQAPSRGRAFRPALVLNRADLPSKEALERGRGDAGAELPLLGTIPQLAPSELAALPAFEELATALWLELTPPTSALTGIEEEALEPTL